MNALTIMNDAKLIALSSSHASYSLRLNVSKTLAVLAGGLVKGLWLDITADSVNIESSGLLSADVLGHGIRSGPGSSSGKAPVNLFSYFFFSAMHMFIILLFENILVKYHDSSLFQKILPVPAMVAEEGLVLYLLAPDLHMDL